MTRWKGGHCLKCGRPIAQKVGEPAKPCPDCTAAKAEATERDSAVEQVVYWRERALDAEGREQALAAHVERMSKAALDAIHYLPGGDIKAELRDAYDDTPETSHTKAWGEQ